MSQVVMKKTELLKKLVENKAKHDAVLSAAVEGYWTLAKLKIEEREKNFYEKITECKEAVASQFNKIKDKIEKRQPLPGSLSISAITVDNNLGLVHPEDHSKDYGRAISIMEASVYDEVSLTVDEFDAYVLNEWEWKKNFINSNSAYVATASLLKREPLKDFAYSGCCNADYVSSRTRAEQEVSNGIINL